MLRPGGTINANDNVEIAIDPTRFPARRRPAFWPRNADRAVAVALIRQSKREEALAAFTALAAGEVTELQKADSLE